MVNKKKSAKTLICVGDVYNAFISGYSSHKICEEFPEKYNVSKRTIERYIHKAKEMLMENCEQNIENWRALSNERYSDLYRRSLGVGDIETCVKIQNSVDKINGLNEKRVSLEVETDPFEDFFKVFGGLADEDNDNGDGNK